MRSALRSAATRSATWRCSPSRSRARHRAPVPRPQRGLGRSPTLGHGLAPTRPEGPPWQSTCRCRPGRRARRGRVQKSRSSRRTVPGRCSACSRGPAGSSRRFRPRSPRSPAVRPPFCRPRAGAPRRQGGPRSCRRRGSAAAAGRTRRGGYSARACGAATAARASPSGRRRAR